MHTQPKRYYTSSTRFDQERWTVICNGGFPVGKDVVLATDYDDLRKRNRELEAEALGHQHSAEFSSRMIGESDEDRRKLRNRIKELEAEVARLAEQPILFEVKQERDDLRKRVAVVLRDAKESMANGWSTSVACDIDELLKEIDP